MMQKIMTKPILAFILFFGSLPVWAQGAAGGLEKAKTVADSIKTGMYALLGAAAGLYLIYLVVMAFTEKKQWSDVAWGVVHVGVAGAIIAIADWAWTLFQ
jgi:hypothetical protein